jgi:4-amino-4-deoxy-L-arabinose transferase-like glycosyltransferase
MVLILPFAYISILLAVGNSRLAKDWRQATSRAAMLWMAYLVLLTEVLSLFNAITPAELFFGWLIPIIAVGFFLRQRFKNGEKILFPKISRPDSWLDWILLGGIVFYLAMTALVAFLAPPNTFDSLNYHLARVAHWVQNQSIRHYMTGLDIQNNNPPGAELILLNIFALTGGDRLVNFAAWAASLGSVVGVSWIGFNLGANRSGQQLAAVFAVTLPMGIAQASSTMNDYVVAFWLVCVAAEIVSFYKDNGPVALLFAGLAAGEAFLTKGTSASYLLPFGIWIFVLASRQLRIKQTLIYGGVALGLALALNAGFVARNLNTYNQMFDPAMSDLHGNQLRNWQGVVSNAMRTVGQQLGTPFPKVNAGEFLVIAKLHQWMGIDVNDPRTTSIGKFRISAPNFNEVRAINPLQTFLILITCLIAIIKIRSMEKVTLLYTLVVLSSLAVYSYLFKWQIFGSRLHLSFLVLFAPMVGYLFSTIARRFKLAEVLGIILLVLSLPWLLRIENRPLLANPAEIPFAGKSLLDTSREDWYFVTSGDKAALKKIANSIEQADCHEVALVISGSSPEYLYWVALDAPRPDLRIEWITTSAVSDKLEDPSFSPCAVICEGCQADDHFRDLPKVLDNGSQQLFLKP